LNVLKRQEDNGGLKEESSIVMKNGFVIRGKTGETPTITDGVQTAPSQLPSPLGLIKQVTLKPRFILIQPKFRLKMVGLTLNQQVLLL